MNKGEFFFAAKKFSEAEKILPVVEHSAKASTYVKLLFLFH